VSLVVLPVIVPLGGAAVVVALNTVLARRWVQCVTVVVALGDVALAAVLLHQARTSTIVYWFGGWTPSHGTALGISFAVDPLGAAGVVLAAVVTAAAAATTGWTVVDAHGFVHALLLTLLAAMAGFCLTGDLLSMFGFFELMAVSAFALAALATQSRGGLRSALNFAITNSVGAFMVLIGIALLYRRTSALNLAQIGSQLAAHAPVDRVTILAFTLVTVGFLIKAAVVPFHFWLVDTASSGPLPLVMLLGGAVDTLGLYGLARVFWTVFAPVLAPHHDVVRGVLVLIGTASAVFGAVTSLIFRRPRRRLGFVVVGHTGIVLVGVGCLTAEGLAGAAVYGVGEGMTMAALFIGAALLDAGATGDRPVGAGPAGAGPAVPSPARRRWGIAVVAASGLGLAGLPLFGTALGKGAIESAAAAAGYWWARLAVGVATVVTAGAVFDLAWSPAPAPTPSGLREPASAGRRPSDPGPPDGGAGSGGRPSGLAAPDGGAGSAWLVPAGVAAGLLGVAVVAGALGRWAANAANRFVDTAGYHHAVLGTPAVVPRSLPFAHAAAIGLSSGDVVMNVLTVVAAVALAAALRWFRTTRPSLSLSRSAVGVVAGRLHDGAIGDSVTWAALGTAIVAVIFAVTLR
jgi:multicomponent Na+:H+ antiporter subunit D